MDNACEHLNIIDWEYLEEIAVGICEICGKQFWTWLASVYGANAGREIWYELAGC